MSSVVVVVVLRRGETSLVERAQGAYGLRRRALARVPLDE